MKRFFAILTVLSMLISLSACSSSGKTKLNKAENTEYGYIIYYDDGWEENASDDGFSIKPVSDAKGISEALITVNVSDTGITDVNEYWSAYESSFKTTFTDYILKKEYTGEEADKLDGINTVHVEYTATVNGALYRFAQVLCINDGHVYNILFSSEEAVFNTYISCLDTIIDNFDFTDAVPAESSAAEISSGRRAESLNGDYYFDYSADWMTDRCDGMISIMPIDGGNASISVQVFSLSDEKANYGVYDYWKEYEAGLKTDFPGYALTKEYSENEPKLGGVVASRKEYSITVDNVKYDYIQVLCIVEGYVYSVLFTSDESEYAVYSGEFDNVIKSFKFE